MHKVQSVGGFMLIRKRKGTWESTCEKRKYSPYSFFATRKYQTQGSYKRGILISQVGAAELKMSGCFSSQERLTPSKSQRDLAGETT